MEIGGVLMVLVAFGFALKFTLWNDRRKADAAMFRGANLKHERLRRVGVEALRRSGQPADPRRIAFAAINGADDDGTDGDFLSHIADEAVAEWRTITSPAAPR